MRLIGSKLMNQKFFALNSHLPNQVCLMEMLQVSTSLVLSYTIIHRNLVIRVKVLLKIK